MKKILFIMGMLVCSLANAQDFEKIDGSGYYGYSISREHKLLLGTPNRFTPNREQIAKVESQLKSEIKSINSSRPNQYKECPKIDRSLRKYWRQYVGYVNPAGDSIVHINFIWKSKNFKDRIDKDYLSILDGCSRYWTVDYNLETGEFFNFRVNGAA
jgi:hypothetical protein